LSLTPLSEIKVQQPCLWETAAKVTQQPHTFYESSKQKARVHAAPSISLRISFPLSTLNSTAKALSFQGPGFPTLYHPEQLLSPQGLPSMPKVNCFSLLHASSS